MRAPIFCRVSRNRKSPRAVLYPLPCRHWQAHSTASRSCKHRQLAEDIWTASHVKSQNNTREQCRCQTPRGTHSTASTIFQPYAMECRAETDLPRQRMHRRTERRSPSSTYAQNNSHLCAMPCVSSWMQHCNNCLPSSLTSFCKSRGLESLKVSIPTALARGTRLQAKKCQCGCCNVIYEGLESTHIAVLEGLRA